MKKRTYLVFCSVLIVLAVFFFLNQRLDSVEADSNDNVFGWAWSENIGWISFNSTNCDSNGDGLADTGNYPQCPSGALSPIPNYGIHIDTNPGPDYGLFSGYAWSENIGWVSFNQFQLTGCPSGSCEARYDSATDQVSGWARALAAPEAGINSGGWDGWIKLRGNLYGAWIEDIAVPNPDEFRNWAWGGDDAPGVAPEGDEVIGWVSFNCKEGGYDETTGTIYDICGSSNYKVMTSLAPAVNNPPTAIPQPIAPPDYCVPVGLYQTLSWVFDDPDGDSQSAYQIVLEDVSSGATRGCPNASDTKVSVPCGDGQTCSCTAIGLEYGKTYRWSALEVWDDGDLKNDVPIIPDSQFFTPLYAYPVVDFDWQPPMPAVGQSVQFCSTTIDPPCPSPPPDRTLCFDPGGCSWLWYIPDFSYATGSNPIIENPIGRFTTEGNKDIELTVTNVTTGNFCSLSKSLFGELPLPEWKEITPF